MKILKYIFNPDYRFKHKHYSLALKNFKRTNLNYEFDVAQLRTIREGFRLEYDKIKEQSNAYEVRITNLQARNAEGDDKEIELVKQQIAKLNEDLAQLQTQMAGIDNEIDGITYQDEQGQVKHHDGLLEKIDKFNTRCEMLKEFIKKL